VSQFDCYPLFVYLSFLFFLTTFFSLLCLFYTGLYGTFILNLVALGLLWLSIIPYVKYIFTENLYYYVSFGKWMYLTVDYRVSFDFLIDIVSLSFSFLTITIAIFVYIYTFSYFRYEPLVDRLVLFLNSFIISMAFLVSSGNFIFFFFFF
jgi:NADH:ubiquinone oxidoreductase subunit 5 (subunit L)/multisubunit Na+/H+ antiporter MnhA subunit